MRQMKILAAALLVAAQAAAQDALNVVFVPTKQLQSDIHKAPQRGPGLSYIDLVKTPEYLADITRRTAPGLAEVHKGVTDIWYVVEGGGTLVTGGSLTGVTETSPGELRGSGVSGGEERKIAKGDFVRIPAGVPHWVRKIDGEEILYLVVKVSSPK